MTTGQYKNEHAFKQAEDALRESEEIIRYIVRHDPNAIAIYDCNLHYLAVSERYLHDYQVREENIIGRHHYDVFPEMPQHWKEVHQRCLAGAVERNDDDYFVRMDGSITWNRWECRPWRRANGEIGGIITYTEVTTERKKAEKALQESERKYRTFFENSMDAILLTCPDGTTLSANQAACLLFGYTEEELIQLGRAGVEDKNDPRLPLLLAERNKHGKARGEVSFRRKDGTLFPAEISTSIFTNNEGRMLSCMIIRDITERKRTEEVIHFKANLLKNVGQAVIATDMDHRVTYWNRAAEKTYGWSNQEAMGKDICQLTLAAISCEKGAEVLQKLLKGKSWSGERIVKRKDGTLMTAYVTDAPLMDPQGMLNGIIEVSNDITARKQAEETLQKLSAAIEQTIDTVAITDRDGIIEYVNPAFEQVTGYTFREAVGCTPRILKSGLSPTEYYQEMWETILSGKVFRKEVINKKKNGELFHEQKTISPLFDKQGNITHFVGTGVDISERKRTEQALQESERLYRSLFNNMLNGLAYCKMIYDRGIPYDFIYLTVNKSFESLTGLKEVTGRKVSDVIPGIRESDPQLFELYGRVALTGVPEKQDLYIDAVKRWFSISVYSPAKEHFVAVFDDITARKIAEAELIKAKVKAEESDRLKSSFLANMSHEVRTPLNSIMSFSEFLADPSLDEDQRKEFTRNIISSGKNLLTVISDIMDLSRIESGEMALQISRVSVSALLKELNHEYLAQARAKGLEWLLTLPETEEETVIDIDADRLRQVLDNLLNNALKFTPSGTIETGYHLYENLVEFYVIDTGIGIPEKYQEKIFDRFRQVDEARTRAYGGNGLGLTICKRLVEMMGGRLWVESEPGKGSSFYFTLPMKRN